MSCVLTHLIWPHSVLWQAKEPGQVDLSWQKRWRRIQAVIPTIFYPIKSVHIKLDWKEAELRID